MNDDTDITQSNFDLLLAWLDPDRDEAGKKYEQIRKRLIKFFECRGRHDAEELADETITRVSRKVEKIAKDYVGDKALYFYGVAKYVYHEAVRKPPPVVLPPSIVKSEDTEKEFECLDQCMEQLSVNNRELMLEYYKYEKRAKIEHRKALAEKLGVAQNALRIRAHRIRLTLEECLRTCLQPQPSV